MMNLGLLAYEQAAKGETQRIAMCKIHHAAFDSFLPSVRPDYGWRSDGTFG
jgi:hypothetical protein